MVKSHEKFVKAHEKLRKTSPTPDFCPAFTLKTLNLHHQFLQNEFFRGGDLYYICANLGGFSQATSHTTAKTQHTMHCELMP